MSADAANLPCPICLHTGVFDTVQSLKDRLIFVSTNNITCPVCQEEVSGLDKLTIHLFSHVKFLSSKEQPLASKTNCNENQCHKREAKYSEHAKKSKSASKNKTTNRSASPVKYVKIYPKLPVVALNTVPLIDISAGSGDGCSPNNQLYISTVKSDAAVVQIHKCNICGLQFADANILNMHKNLVHDLDDNSNRTVTRYDCHLCPKNFKMRGSLMVHLRVAHFGFSTNNSDANKDDKSKDSNVNHQSEKLIEIERQDGKQWQCDVCRKCFTTKYFLKKHKRLHTGETPYACSQCNKTFTFQQSYHKHLLYHNDEKPHTCSFCGRSFKELSTLHNHQRIHTGEKPFACESCGKCFRQRVSYLVHRRIHTGAMPYKCTSCNKSFRYKVSQRTHKCQAQPPGTVVRKIGDLVEKLKKKNTDGNVGENDGYNVNFSEVSETNAELVRTGAKLSLQDIMESENFAIISGDFNENTISALDSNKCNDENQNLIQTLDELIDYIPMNEKSIPSPSEILKNLCLTNNEEVSNDEKMYFQEEFNTFI